jgi:hypothetical protein
MKKGGEGRYTKAEYTYRNESILSSSLSIHIILGCNFVLEMHAFTTLETMGHGSFFVIIGLLSGILIISIL